MQNIIKNKAELEAELYSMFTLNPDKKKNFLADPRKFLNEEFGLDLTESVNVNIVQHELTELVIGVPKEAESGNKNDD